MKTVLDALAAPPARPGRFAGARSGVLALLDQAVVSGTNFLTIVLVGRTCGQEQLGFYSLGFTVLVLVAAAQESLITAPYTVFRERVGGRDRAEYAGSVLAQQVGLAVLAAVGLAAAAALAGSRLGPVGWAVAVAVPAALLRDFCRRFAFADLRMAGALALDLAVAGLQLGTLAWLASAGRLTAVTAFAAVGGGCGAVGLAGLYLARDGFALRPERLGRDADRHWAFGRWVAAGQMVGVAHAYAVHWLLAAMAGPAETGAFAACLAVITLSNPFFLGVSNLLGPRAARARAAGGRGEVRRVVGRAAALLAAGMGGFALAIEAAGGPLLRVLYGAGYTGHAVTLGLLGAALVVAGPGMAADHGLRALERPRAVFSGSLIGLAVTAAATVALVPVWGVDGAACGYLLGAAASAAVRVAAFLRVSADGADEGRAEA